MLLAGVGLAVLGAVLLVGQHLAAGYERHSFTDGQPPPRYVDLVAGRTYWLGVPDGVAHEQSLGLPPRVVQCTAVQRDGPETALQVNAERQGTKMINLIGSFRAPVTAAVHITCPGLDEVYVDNVESDPSGWLLVIGTAALMIAVPLVLSGIRAGVAAPRADEADVNDALRSSLDA